MRENKVFLAFFIIAVLIFININIVFAQTAAEKFKSGLIYTGQEAGYPSSDLAVGESLLPYKIGKIIRAILSFLGVIFLVLMIYGGYTWMTARGNDQQVSKARSIVINSIIGLIIIMAAWAITYFAGVLWSHMSVR